MVLFNFIGTICQLFILSFVLENFWGLIFVAIKSIPRIGICRCKDTAFQIQDFKTCIRDAVLS